MTLVNFEIIERQCEKIIKIIEEKQDELIEILTQYQPHNVVNYGIERCIRTLKNIGKNQQYFKEKVDAISVFIPSNLPLYSFVIFALIPGFIAKKLYVYPNTVLRKQKIMQDLHKILQIEEHLPSIKVIAKTIDIEGYTGKSKSITHSIFIEECVKKSNITIFTGRNETKKEIEKAIHSDSMLIYNGSGHNPIVVTENADIKKSVEDSVFVKFFNSGQDCAGPDCILIHKKIASEFIEKFKEKCSELKVGNYSDKETFIGPIHRGGELSRLSKIIDNNRSSVIHIENVAPGEEVNRDKKIVYPTIISSKITEKINFQEVFGPIAFITEYEEDAQLKLYFEDKRYKNNKMYVSLYGNSTYIESRDDVKFLAKAGSTKDGIGIVLYNETIHDVEIGTKAYGGYSKGASSVMYKNSEGEISNTALPILIPQIIADLLIRTRSMEELQELVNEKLMNDLRSKNGDIKSKIEQVNIENSYLHRKCY